MRSRSLSMVAVLGLLHWSAEVFGDYPCWRGESGSGSSKDCGEEIVGSLAETRLVWLGEARTYQAYPEGVYGWRPYLHTGQGGPVVADGRVFLYYFMPDGKVYNKGAAGTFQGAEFDPTIVGFNTREEVIRRYYSVAADDVLLCADAKTGKTLWQRNIPGGMNHGGRRGGWAGTKSGPLLTPCVAYGKVFFGGSTYRVFALDVKTGETVWKNDLGKVHDGCQQALKAAMEAEDNSKLPVGWFTGGHAPTYADGVVCFDDECGGIYGGGLIAFDAETGKKLWSIPPGVNSYPGPVRWTHKEKEYFVSGRGALIEPKTGRVLWGPFGSAMPIVVNDEYMITCPADMGAKWECRRITPEKADLVWSAGDARIGAGGFTTPVITRGYLVWANNSTIHSIDLATGKRLQTSPGGAITRTSCSLLSTDGAIIMENSDVVYLQRDGALSRGRGYRSEIPGHKGLLYCNSTTGAIDDGYWFIREADRLACFQLRKELHARARPLAGDMAKLLGLLADPDPAVAVDAAVAVRRSGDKSQGVVDAMVACLDKPRFGVAAEASRLLLEIDPPPAALLTAAASENRERRLGALRSLSKLETLPVKVLAMAAAEPLFAGNDQAAKFLASRCGNDLSPMVEAIAALDNDAIRGRLLKLMRASLNPKTAPSVLRAVSAQLGGAGAGSANGLLQSVATVGNDEAWKLLAAIVADRAHAHRSAAVDALRRWPDERPFASLEEILADKQRESETTRANALRGILPLIERRVASLPVNGRAEPLKAKLAVARELGMEKELLAALGRTGSPQAMEILGSYINHASLSDAALEALETCGKTVTGKSMGSAVIELEAIMAKAKSADRREDLKNLIASVKERQAKALPSAEEMGGGAEGPDLGL